MIGVDAYEKFEHEKELLRVLVKGNSEVEAGEGYDLDTVLREERTVWSGLEITYLPKILHFKTWPLFYT